MLQPTNTPLTFRQSANINATVPSAASANQRTSSVTPMNPFDINRDGVVNWDDVVAFFHQPKQGQNPQDHNPFDINHDGHVDWDDLKAFLNQNLPEGKCTGLGDAWEMIKDKFFPILVNFINSLGSIPAPIQAIILGIIYTIDNSPKLPQDTLVEKMAALSGEQIRKLFDEAFNIHICAAPANTITLAATQVSVPSLPTLNVPPQPPVPTISPSTEATSRPVLR